MGVDITFMPIPGDINGAPCVGGIFRNDDGEAYDGYSHAVLPMIRSYELLDPLQDIQDEHGIDVPERFHTYLGRPEWGGGEQGYGNTQEDSYGSALKHVPVSELRALKNHERVEGVPWNRALWAYFEAMPDDARIVIFWN